MVLVSAFTLLEAATGGLLAWIVAGVSTLTLSLTRINPLHLIAAGGLVFALLLNQSA